MSDLLEFAIHLAEKTGDILLRYYEPLGIGATQKADFTFVTEADIAADQFITSQIHDHFPEDEIISEESSHYLKRIDATAWIIDPLDGTTNFSLGLSVWGISIALVKDGQPILGVLYFPLLKELYTCELGLGSYLNQMPLKTKAPDPKLPMSFFACCSRSYRYYNIDIPYKPRIFGSGAYTFCMVARGSALLGLDAASKIWDLAAGWLLVNEAGGLATALEGDAPFPLSPLKDYRVTNFPVLAAATTAVLSYGKTKIQRKPHADIDIHG